MKRYIIKRIWISLVMLFGISVLLYMITRQMPGDYVSHIAVGNPNITPRMEQQLREAYGLDKGLVEGYLSWLWNALHGDFGTSLVYREPVVDVIWRYMPPTIALAGISFCLELLLAVPLGILAARKQYSFTDYLVVTTAIVGISLPSFFFAAILKRIFSIELSLLPISGMVTARANYTGIEWFLDLTKHFILPVIVFTITGMGSLLRYVRIHMLEVLQTDYIRMARAKGLPEYRVIGKHGFRNALLPIVTLLGGMIPGLFSGAVVIEGIFSIEGLGKIALNAVYAGDIPYLMGFNLFLAAMTLLGTLLADILYAAVDPRVRY